MKNSNKKYYSLAENGETAVLNIFGDITSYAWEELGEMSNVLLSKKLEEMTNVSTIDVYINSYGGEVAEGLAIYNALKRHKAKVRTHIDGFACSIASVIFMAGDERIMPETSLLMIHNPWTFVSGNAKELRKQAEDLEKIGECSINAYLERINISKDELIELLDNETWIASDEAIEMGFATECEKEETKEHANQSIKKKIVNMLLNSQENKDSDSDDDSEDSNSEEPDIETDDENENKKTDESETDNVGEKPDDNEADDNSTDDENVGTDDENNDDSADDEDTSTDDENKREEQALNMINAYFNKIEKEILNL